MSTFLWAVFPYVCLTLFFVVPFMRLRRRPFEFSTRASSTFARRWLGFSSLLFHWGIIILIVAHAIGLVGGVLGLGGWVEVFFWLGAAGGIMALVGSISALLRRIRVREVRALSQHDDFLVHVFLISIMGLALYQSLALWIWGASYNAGLWLASVFYFRPQPELMAGAPIYTQLHVFLALAFIAYFPFTKLVHAWTYPVNYFVRPYQVMRTATRKFQRRFELALRTDGSVLLYSAGVVLVLLLGLGFLLKTPAAPPRVLAEAAVTGVTGALTTTVTPSALAAQPDGTAGVDDASGYLLFLGSCARCHGPNGDGQVISRTSRSFAEPPRDLTTGRFRFVSTVDGVAVDADLRHVIVAGLPSAGMPGFSHLTAAQVDSLVQVIDEMWVNRPTSAGRIDPGAVPNFTSSMAVRGRSLFDAVCSTCHGRTGSGDGPGAATLPVPPANLALGRVKAGTDPLQLYYRIAAGIVGDDSVLMPPFGSLGQEQIWSVVAYLKTDLLP